MSHPVILLAQDLPGLALGCQPETLAREHPSWAETVREWGPWSAQRETGMDASCNHPPPWSLVARTSSQTCPARVFLCLACSSALDLAWELWDRVLVQDWDAVLAVRQWAGRGQVRRPWSSLPGNLHVVWRQPELPPGWGGLASLVPAWLTARGLARMGLEVCIKWPNDLLWQDRKLGGILVEQRGDRTLAGLGLNLAAAPGPEHIRAPAAVQAIALNGRISPARCWSSLVSESITWYRDSLPSLRPEDFLQDFSAMLAWKGRRVLFHDHGQDAGHEALLVGVDVDGGLVLSAGHETRTVHSGELRLAFAR